MNVIQWEFGAVTPTDLARHVARGLVVGRLIPIRLEVAVRNFLTDLEFENRSPRTIHFYDDNLSHLVKLFPDADVGEIDADRIRQFARSRDLSKTHALHAHYRSFRAFFNWCVGQQYIAENPMRYLNMPKLPQRIKPTLSPAELKKLLLTQPTGTFLGRRNRMIVMILLDTGIRAGELLGLTLEDIDTKHGGLRIRSGKGDKERVVRLSRKTLKMTRLYLGMDTHPRDRAVHRGKSSMFMVSEERRPLTYDGLREAIAHMARLADIHTKVSPHVFRHTWARMTLASGVDSRYVQTLGGWSSLDMVGVYTKDQRQDDALAAQQGHLLVDKLL